MYKFPHLNAAVTTAALGTAIVLASASLASAGECPAGNVKEGAVTSGPTAPVGVTDTVIGSIDLDPKGGDFAGQLLRMRKPTIEPGGIVPWHEHSERPANIYVISGTIEEHRANCTVPIGTIRARSPSSSARASRIGGRTPAPSRWF